MTPAVIEMPRRPDLGPVKVVSDPRQGALLNVAGVVELCRTGDTDKCRRVYRAFLKAWDEIRDDDASEGDKQFMALKMAFATIGAVIGDGETTRNVLGPKR